MYAMVESWLNTVLSEADFDGVKAVVFNLYEEYEDSWSMECVGCAGFDPEDEDWACDEVTDFGTRENRFIWSNAKDWEEAQKQMTSSVTKYLKHGKYADALTALKGIGIGFVDGDLELIRKEYS